MHDAGRISWRAVLACVQRIDNRRPAGNTAYLVLVTHPAHSSDTCFTASSVHAVVAACFSHCHQLANCTNACISSCPLTAALISVTVLLVSALQLAYSLLKHCTGQLEHTRMVQRLINIVCQNIKILYQDVGTMNDSGCQGTCIAAGSLGAAWVDLTWCCL